MANFGKLRLTQLGEDLQAKVQTGATMAFSFIAIGSGIWSDPQNVNAMTALVNRETTIPITQVKDLGGGQYMIQAVIDSDDFIGHSYDHTECGIYADDPDLGDILYMASYATEPDHIPSNTDGVAYSTVINFVLTISDQAAVTVTVDNASAATLGDLETTNQNLSDHISDESAHNATPAASANRMVIRDSNGRASFGRPIADDHAFRKIDGDAIAQNLSDHISDRSAHNATSAASANRMVIRDSNGRASFGRPIADDHAFRKIDGDAITPAKGGYTQSAPAASIPDDGITRAVATLRITGNVKAGDIGILSVALDATKGSVRGNTQFAWQKEAGSAVVHFVRNSGSAVIYYEDVEAGRRINIDADKIFRVYSDGSIVFRFACSNVRSVLSINSCRLDITWLKRTL
jgi:hypothetical protein